MSTDGQPTNNNQQPATQTPIPGPSRTTAGDSTSAPANSGTDANPGSSTGDKPTGLNPDLVSLAKSSAYGFSEQQLADFKSDDDLQQALIRFDMQPAFSQPWAMQQPPQFGQQAQPPQPQYGYQQQYGVPQNGQPQSPPPPPPGMPKFDRESMDEQQLQAFDYLSSTVQSQQQMLQQLNQHVEQMAFQSYMSQMSPLLDGLNDQRLSNSTPFGQANREQFLMQVENMRIARQQRGMNVSDADLVKAVYQQFSQSQGSANNQGFQNQFIGQPGNQQVQPPNNPDQRAMNAMDRYGIVDDPVQKANAARDAMVRNSLPE